MTVIFWQPATASSASPGPRLLAAYLEFKRGTLYRKYAAANPIESSQIDSYWNGGDRPSVARTPTGKGLLGWADVYREL